MTRERERRIAAEIEALLSRSGRETFKCEIETGKLLIEGLHAGNTGAWRKRRRNKKDLTLRAISKLLHGARSPSELYYAGCAYLITQQHPHVRASEHLTASHLREVSGLPEDQALRLLEQASREKASVRTLHELAGRLRSPGKGGRPRTPLPLRQIKAVSAVPLPPADVDFGLLLSQVPAAARRVLASDLWRHAWLSTDLAIAVGRHATTAARKAVLVVDHEATWRLAVGHWLDNLGYQAFTAATPAEARPMLGNNFEVAIVAGDHEFAHRLLVEQRTKRTLLVTERMDDCGLLRTKAPGLVIARQELPWGVFRALHAIERELAASRNDECPSSE